MKKNVNDTLNYFIIIFGVLGVVAMLGGAGLGIAWKLGAILYEVEESILILFVTACVCWAIALGFCIADNIVEIRREKNDKKDV